MTAHHQAALPLDLRTADPPAARLCLQSCQILLRELPGRPILRDRHLSRLGIADDFLRRGIKPDRTPELKRKQAQYDRDIHVGVVEDAATGLLPGFDAIQPFPFVAGDDGMDLGGGSESFILSPSGTILNWS